VKHAIWLDSLAAPIPTKGEASHVSDVSREEMLTYLRGTHGPCYYEYDMEVAMYWFASDYHDGDASQLFQAMRASPLGKKDKAFEVMSDEANFLYCDLVSHFSSQEGT
jgi:hypothetical protein